MLTFIFHTDMGHGWLEVNKSLVKKLGIKVSQYSYQNGTKAYLEEDCDAGELLNALKAEGIEYKIETKHTDNDHPLRNYARYSDY